MTKTQKVLPISKLFIVHSILKDIKDIFETRIQLI